MKRAFRRAALLLMVCLLCIGLCGCNVDVDELRAQHGVWNADGNIVLNDATYKRLPDAVKPEVDWAYDNDLFVSEADVPLLIARIMGDNCYFDTTGTLINRYSAVYCRSDQYDDIVRRYQFRYGYYDEDGNIVFNGVVYKRMEDINRSRNFCPCYSEGSRSVFIADEEMPLLSMQQYLCDELYMDGNGILLEDWSDLDNTDNSDFYCRKDRYDDIMRQINEGADYTCYGYTLNEQSDGNPFAEKIYPASADFAQAVDTVKATVAPTVEDLMLYKGDCLFLLKASADLLFAKSAAMAVIEDGDGYILVDYSGDTMLCYAVPSELSVEFLVVFQQWKASGLPSLEYVGEYY